MKIVVFVGFSICFNSLYAAAASSCGDWVPYKDEKCFKVFDKLGFQNFTDAQAACAQHDNAKLISISVKDEQSFLENFLFKQNHVIDNLWIGAKYSASVFSWNDGSKLSYTNWDSKSPKNHADYCVQMRGDVEAVGKWSDEPCGKRNLVACEKKQPLTLAHMQSILLEVRNEVHNLEQLKQEIQNFAEMKQEIKNLKKEVQSLKQPKVQNNEQLKQDVQDLGQLKENVQNLKQEVQSLKQKKLDVQNLEKLKQDVQNLGQLKQEVKNLGELKQTVTNLIPIGFIYVQLPKEKAPKEIWPSMTWTDVSSTYSGVFFRVSGGHAASFGTVQDFSPNFSAEKGSFCMFSIFDHNRQHGGWHNDRNHDNCKMHMQNGEVRPRNMAVKVWKRTG